MHTLSDENSKIIFKRMKINIIYHLKITQDIKNKT